MVKVQKTITKKPAVEKPKKPAVKKLVKETAVKIKPVAKKQTAPKDEGDIEVFDIDAIKIGDKSKYIPAIGRRKTASAQVRLFTQGKKGIEVNGKPYGDYFPKFLHKTVEESLETLKCLGKFGATVIVRGGGKVAQAEAVRHGLARCLITLNPYFKKRLKKFGYLTRDPRMRERKKPGLKRARKAPQWSKR